MSRPSPSTPSSTATGPTAPSRPLGSTAKGTSTSSKAGSTSAAPGPRRSAGVVPGIARTASTLRQGGQPNTSLASIPVHLRNLSAPRIPSPLGKGTPARGVKQSLPVRTSKTTERHVLLPEDPQLAPIPRSPGGSSANLSAPPRREQPGPSRGQHLAGPYSYEERSDAEKMTKREREENGLARFTAYATAEGYRLKMLQAFLRREHGVGVVRVYDDCIYAVYNLPLLPGYGASTLVRSSPAVKSPGGVSMLERMTIAEDMGYNDSYFPINTEDGEQHYGADPNEYILAHSPPVSPRDLLLSVDPSHDQSPGREEREQAAEDALQRAEEGDSQRDRETSPIAMEPPPVPASFDEDEEPVLAPADREHNLIETGTHMSPEHPGYLEHVPAQALSPDQLHPDLEGERREREWQHRPEYQQRHDRRHSSGQHHGDAGQGQGRGHGHGHGHGESITITREDAIEHQRAFTGQAQMFKQQRKRTKSFSDRNPVAEAVFYSYGVSVFFGFTETQEKEIMEDCLNAGAWSRPQEEDEWEVEECHYVYDREAEFPRIFNDMFTFKSHNHLFKLSLAHAIAQSTKLSIYEAVMQESLALTSSFPKELSTTGHLQMTRREALKMTGRLFKLRMDVNLIGGILDTPELFWSEASLYPLYEAIREYLEIGPRVQVLNDRLAVVGDLVEIMHEYLEEQAAHRLTWIVIWLIVAACLVEAGEVVARMVFHSLPRKSGDFLLVKGGQMVINGVKSFSS